MLKNYFIVALRNILRQKGYSFINIAGLVIGLTCCIFLFIWVNDELSYDRFNTNSDRIYRILVEIPRPNAANRISSFTAPMVPVGLKENYPGIEEFLRFKILGNVKPNILLSYGDKIFNEPRFAFGDGSLFRMFSFKFLKGNPRNALPNPNSIVITEKLAKKYFGNEDPMGKLLIAENKYPYTVTGVIEDIPGNSHIKFNSVIPFENIETYFTYYGKFLESYGLHQFNNYIMVSKNTQLQDLRNKAAALLTEKNKNFPYKLLLQPLNDIHLHSKDIGDSEKRGDITDVTIFSITGLFILLIACINFINLTTAQAAKRSKEIGMRKVIGATRQNLIRQFFAETIVYSLTALFIAIVLVIILMPYFNDLTGKHLSLGTIFCFSTVSGILGIALLTGVLSGIYPALYLSAAKPVRILKGLNGSEKGRSVFRKIMVTAQFFIAVSLIICTIIIFRQYVYIQNRDLGFDKENFLYFSLYGQLKGKYEIAQNEFTKNPNIISSCASSSIMSQGSYATDNLNWEGRDWNVIKNLQMSFVSVSKEFIETFNLKMAKGSSFAKNPPQKENEEVIINETAAKLIGIEPIVGLGAIIPGGPRNGKIIGVVKDYNFSKLQNKINPLVISIEPPVFRYLLVKIKPENMNETISYIKNVCKMIEPGFPFEFHFMDEAFDNLYIKEKQMRNILEIFTFIAIFVSCLGLVGLSSYTAKNRTREIGVRKVLGASIPNILKLLSTEYIVLISIANLLAWPVSYYLMNNWLRDFAYRTEITPFIFLVTGLISIIFSLLAVGWHTFKAAAANPINSLRSE